MLQTSLNRLSNVAAIIMGEASAPAREHILCLLPFPEDPKIINSIRKKHPNVDIEYHHIAIVRGDALTPKSLPDGTSLQIRMRAELT